MEIMISMVPSPICLLRYLVFPEGVVQTGIERNIPVCMFHKIYHQSHCHGNGFLVSSFQLPGDGSAGRIGPFLDHHVSDFRWQAAAFHEKAEKEPELFTRRSQHIAAESHGADSRDDLAGGDSGEKPGDDASVEHPGLQVNRGTAGHGIQTVPEHQIPVQLCLDLAVGDACGADHLLHIRVSAAVQGKVAEESEYVCVSGRGHKRSG